MAVRVLFYHDESHLSRLLKALDEKDGRDRIFVIASLENSRIISKYLMGLKTSPESYLDSRSPIDFIHTDDGTDLLEELYYLRKEEEVDDCISYIEIDVSDALPEEVMVVSKVSAIMDVRIFRTDDGGCRIDIESFPRLLHLDRSEADMIARIYHKKGFKSVKKNVWEDRTIRFTRNELSEAFSLSYGDIRKNINSLLGKGCLIEDDNSEYVHLGRKDNLFKLRERSIFSSLIHRRMSSTLDYPEFESNNVHGNPKNDES